MQKVVSYLAQNSLFALRTDLTQATRWVWDLTTDQFGTWLPEDTASPYSAAAVVEGLKLDSAVAFEGGAPAKRFQLKQFKPYSPGSVTDLCSVLSCLPRPEVARHRVL